MAIVNVKITYVLRFFSIEISAILSTYNFIKHGLNSFDALLGKIKWIKSVSNVGTTLIIPRKSIEVYFYGTILETIYRTDLNNLYKLFLTRSSSYILNLIPSQKPLVFQYFRKKNSWLEGEPSVL